MSDFKAILT